MDPPRLEDLLLESMKKNILSFLADKKGDYVSGEEMSSELGISRAAIWKHIKKLREEGVEIDSSSRLGYAYREEPLLDLKKMQERSNSKWMSLVDYSLNIDGSTNNIAKRSASEGAKEGTIILVEGQNGGRGRFERHFNCPFAKGLWFSLILRPEIGFSDITKIVIMITVAVRDAIMEVTGLKLDVKWPNDLLYNGRKVTGILLEGNGELERLNYLVAGIGINVNQDLEDFTDELREKASSLYLLTDKKVDRERLFCVLLEKLEEYYEQISSDKYLDLWQSWKDSSCLLNRRITVTLPNKKIEGIVEDFTLEGALLLRLDDGELMTVLAGEASLKNV